MTDFLALVVSAAKEAETQAQETDAERRTRMIGLARRYYVTRRCSMETAAEAIGVSVGHLAGLLAEGGVELRGQKPRRRGVRREIDNPQEFARQLAEEYAAGESLNALSLAHNLGKDRTREFIRAGGGTIRPTGTAPSDVAAGQPAEIVRLRGEGWSYRRIQDHLGCSAYRISQALHLAEVKPREFKRRPKNGGPPSRAEIERLITRYSVELVGIVKLARLEGWDWRRLRDLFIAEGVRIRGPGPVPKRK